MILIVYILHKFLQKPKIMLLVGLEGGETFLDQQMTKSNIIYLAVFESNKTLATKFILSWKNKMSQSNLNYKNASA